MTSFALAKKNMISTKGLTIAQLLRSTDTLRKSGSGDTIIKALSFTKTGNGMLVAKAKMLSAKGPPVVYDTWITFMELKDRSKIAPTAKIMAQCSCVTGDTKVLTDKGWQTIFEIAEEHISGYYPINYNINGYLYEGSAPFYTGLKDVWKVELSNGLSVSATKEHQFLRFQNLGNYKTKEEWVELQNLEIGDKLVSNYFEASQISHKRKFWEAFFVGILQGDGTLFASGRPNLKLYNHKKVLLNYIQKYGFVKDYTKVKDRDAINVHLSHRALEVVARYQFQNKKGVKLDNLTQIMGYLSGLVATDGTMDTNGDISISGAKEYLEPLVWYLMSYGYTQIRLVKKRGIGAKTKICGVETSSTKELWALTISSKSNILKNLVLPDYHTDKIDSESPKRDRKPWVKIVDITYAGKQHVYDITVPEVERFSANGVIAHNCADYMYRWEYANAAHNAARIFYGNGEPPDEQNPAQKPGLCKHAYCLAKKLIETY